MGFKKNLVALIVLLLLGSGIVWGYTQISSFFWKVIYLLGVIDLFGICLVLFPKTRTLFALVPTIRKKYNFHDLLGYLKKHWIIFLCIIALFVIIYPTILFIYIKFLIANGWLYLLALWPCLILLLKNKKISPRIILGIDIGCFFTFLLLILWIRFYPNLPRNFDARNSSSLLFFGLSIFYLIALLPMFILKKKKICWSSILFVINTTAVLLFAILKTSIPRDDFRNYYISNLTNIRTIIECKTADAYSEKVTKRCSRSGNKFYGHSSCDWIGYDWIDGLCVKSQKGTYSEWIV